MKLFAGFGVDFLICRSVLLLIFALNHLVRAFFSVILDIFDE